MNFRMLLGFVLPMIRQAGEMYKAQDSNDTGQDDMIGASLIYAADILHAVVNHNPVPRAPEVLSQGAWAPAKN